SYGTVPAFQLTNQNGQTFGSPQLAGKIWIADFIYTTCPGPCPMISSRMSELQKPLEKRMCIWCPLVLIEGKTRRQFCTATRRDCRLSRAGGIFSRDQNLQSTNFRMTALNLRSQTAA